MNIYKIIIGVISVVLLGCTSKNTNNTKKVESTEMSVSLTQPNIRVFKSSFPLNIKDINFNDSSKLHNISEDKIVEIEKTIENFYYDECSGDTTETYFTLKDRYIGTIELEDSIYTLYIVVLQRPEGILTSKILFFNNDKKQFTTYLYNLNIHAMYDYQPEGVIVSNLKHKFLLDIPEIDKNVNTGPATYKLTRLYHNGTSNGIESLVVQVKDNYLDTLQSAIKWQ